MSWEWQNRHTAGVQPPFPFHGSFSDMQGTVALRVSSHPAPHPPRASKAASKASSTHRTWLPPPPSQQPWRARPPRALGLCPQARVAGPGMAQPLEMIFWKMNEGVLLLPQSGAGPDHGAHLAPRTPPDATRAKIHTNIYSVPASGWGAGGRAQDPRRSCRPLQTAPGEGGALAGRQGPEADGPWRGPEGEALGGVVAGGLAWFPEVTESRWVWRGQFPPIRPRPGWTLGPGGCQGASMSAPGPPTSPPAPPPTGKAAPGSCFSRWERQLCELSGLNYE